MNKVILFAGGTVVTLGVLVASSGLAFAANDNASQMGNGRNGYAQQLQVKASALNLSVTDLQEQLKTKTLAQIAAAKGVSMGAIHDATSKQAQANWAANGLTADQIKERTAAQAQRQADCDGTGSGNMNAGGMHRNQNNN
ncbi:hypothetical protein HJC99_06120 [Candidatus Saccharibacteria bacterium]|nr:hypothetical protein [Candidatus Saccharibacteria bacterium]